jgi:hypothetical protein
LETHTCSITLPQLAKKTKINYKSIGKHIKTLTNKQLIDIEPSVYDKRKKLIKLTRINDFDVWFIRELIELNEKTIDDLKEMFPHISDIKTIVEDLELECVVNQNEITKREREERRLKQEPRIRLPRSEEKQVKYSRYLLCLKKRLLEVENLINNGIDEKQKPLLREKYEKIERILHNMGITPPEIIYEKFYSASYINNLIEFII